MTRRHTKMYKFIQTRILHTHIILSAMNSCSLRLHTCVSPPFCVVTRTQPQNFLCIIIWSQSRFTRCRLLPKPENSGKAVAPPSQSCRQIEISPEFGSFSGAFLGVLNNNVKILCYMRKIRELFGSFFGY